MNDQPKPSFDDDCTMPPAAPGTQAYAPVRRVPGGPRAHWTWPVELEAEPWRPS